VAINIATAETPLGNDGSESNRSRGFVLFIRTTAQKRCYRCWKQNIRGDVGKQWLRHIIPISEMDRMRLPLTKHLAGHPPHLDLRWNSRRRLTDEGRSGLIGNRFLTGRCNPTAKVATRYRVSTTGRRAVSLAPGQQNVVVQLGVVIPCHRVDPWQRELVDITGGCKEKRTWLDKSAFKNAAAANQRN